MISVGDKVRVVGKPDMCCGNLHLGNKGIVISIIEIEHTETQEEAAIVILDDNSLHWEKDLEKETCQH